MLLPDGGGRGPGSADLMDLAAADEEATRRRRQSEDRRGLDGLILAAWHW